MSIPYTNLTHDMLKRINIFVGKEVGTIVEFFNMLPTYIPTMYSLCDDMHYSLIEDEATQTFKSYLGVYSNIVVMTQSLDVINVLPEVIESLHMEDEFQIIRIGRSACASNRGELICTIFDDFVGINGLIEYGHEFR